MSNYYYNRSNKCYRKKRKNATVIVIMHLATKRIHPALIL